LILHHQLKGDRFFLAIPANNDIYRDLKKESMMILDFPVQDQGVPELHKGVLDEIKCYFPVGSAQKAKPEK